MNREDIAFFKSRQGYRRIFEGIREKYRSLGRIGGVIKLTNLTDEEKEILSNHFKRDYSKNKSANIDVSAFEKSLKQTRFENYSLIEILEEYFGEKLTTKKEDIDAYNKEKQDFFEQLRLAGTGRRCAQWLDSIKQEKAVGMKAINQRYDRDKNALKKDILLVCDAIDNLPVYKGEKVRLPVFASRITLNPHGFDLNTDCGNLLKWALCTIMGLGDVRSSEEVAELYYRAGILLDEISNYVTLSGLIAYRGSKTDEVFEAAYYSNEVLQVPLLHLSKIDSVKSPLGKVYVVENPGVFTTLLDTSAFLPLVCTYGQPKLSSLVLLDLLYREGTEIYYSGDFDPEGLSIADRLYKRYKECFHFWRYTVDDYKKAQSNEILSDRRLNILKSIEAFSLREIVEEMSRVKKAGYQELIIDKLISDLSSISCFKKV